MNCLLRSTRPTLILRQCRTRNPTFNRVSGLTIRSYRDDRSGGQYGFTGNGGRDDRPPRFNRNLGLDYHTPPRYNPKSYRDDDRTYLSRRQSRMSGARGCFNCGGFGHQAANCPKAGTPTCYNCGEEGHVSRDCTGETKAKTCYKCNETGHISRDCPNGGSTQQSSSSSGGSCYTCGQTGHMARNCPQGGESRQSRGFSSFGGGNNNNNSRTCYTCGGVGHMSRDCVQGSKCYNCNGVGHISRDCTEPQKRACYQCGQEGHISRDCPGAGEAA